MKGLSSTSTGWHSHKTPSTSNPPLTPTYTSPRLPPAVPSQPLPVPHHPPHQKSPFKAFHSVFRKQQQAHNSLLAPPAQQPHRTPSIRSAYSASTTSSDTNSVHPYAQMHVAPIPVVSSHDSLDDEAECPVCLEPLSFSFRLPGEKPHIVPECGHALHEACFTAVYGPPPNQRSAVARKSNLGVCGVCRRPMKVGDGDSGKSNKLAALTGMGDHKAAPLYPGRDTPTSRRRAPSAQPYDPNEDDALDHTGSVKSHGQDHPQYIVAPSIQVRPEFSSLTRTADPSQPLTCIVIIELPGKRPATVVPGPVMPDPYSARNGVNHHMRRETTGSGHSSPRPDHPSQQQIHQPQSRRQQPDQGGYPNTSSTYSNGNGHESSVYSNTEEPNPFSAITEDLRNRIIDWKGHPLSDLGPLQMYDLLSVRRDSAIREFYVYLFKEAIICVVEEKKRGLGRLLSSASGFSTDPGSHSSASSQAKGVLRLKGRIYVRHIKNVTASSAAGEMSLTIDMEDELASFILIFKDRSSLESWRSSIQNLVNQFQAVNGPIPPPQSQGQPGQEQLDMEEFGGSAKAARMLSGGSTGTTMSSVDSLLNGGSSARSLSSSTSLGSLRQPHQQHPHGMHHHQGGQYHHNGNMPQKLSTLGEDDEYSSYDTPPPPASLVTPYTSSGPSNSLTPLPHPPMDLIIVISIPPPSAPQSTAQLKIRVIRATFDFMIASLGSKDRLSLVTFEVGLPGRVRKTPFLSLGKAQSRGRLEKFVDELGMRMEESQDEFLVRGKEEKTDVVTAVNHGLDVVLQRKARNPVSGMILVSDASDSTRRAQMDLVLARAEAANVPIHSFGYGRSHDPASLWLMSNHTSGTYTFVKDWYDLRSCIAGCVGGMMSIGLLNMKLHMKIVDSNRFRIRKISGGPSSVLSSDGQNVDVDVGELRYGERKEMLIELELDNTDSQRLAMKRQQQQQALLQQQQLQANGGYSSGGGGSNGMGGGPHGNRAMNATDQFVQSLGLDSLSIGDDAPDFVDGMMDRMIDEVPVVEVDGSFFDPAAAKHVSRLAHPVLLTITLLPLGMTSGGMGMGMGGMGGGGMGGMMGMAMGMLSGGGNGNGNGNGKANSSSSSTNSNGNNNGSPGGGGPSANSDAVIVRRRMELLASDMITRALVLVSRRNFSQAQNILGETKRILHTVLQNISRGLPPPGVGVNGGGGGMNGGMFGNGMGGGMGMGGMGGGSARNRKELLTLNAVRAIQAILQDLQILVEALEDNVEIFAHDQRNFGAQQAMILRDQKSWSGRSATEKLFWTTDNSIELASRSTDWVARE
ncbi:hypothetical protein BDN72DRAFT_893718 [Pluteus cervinus]|uniref:Uncharacterized protein n=1 Tax=Pluteus cervinus TaxID=181527 RepID=A0ACD3B7H4_9AGAR|nr:hypothetical protein BDN72DRAFT_893718 [Pluteus cervinus]